MNTSQGRLATGITASLLALTLVGPYLPLPDVSWLAGRPGFRLDHVLLPIGAVFLLFHAWRNGHLWLPLPFWLYVAFYVWLVFQTALSWSDMPPSNRAGIVAATDGYLRPLLWLVIGFNVRLPSPLARRLIFCTVIAAAIVAVCQVTPGPATVANAVLEQFYDNTGGAHFRSIIKGGRVAAFMPQLSTLGMFAVLAIGCAAAALHTRRGWIWPALAIVAASVAGILSGSKVFYGGVAFLFPALWLLWPGTLRRRTLTIGAATAIGVVTWLLMGLVFPGAAGRTESGFTSLAEGNVGAYLSTRYAPDTGKVFRSGIIKSIKADPITGSGFTDMGKTTDTFWLGLMSMGGAIGTALYSLFLLAVAVRLWCAPSASRTFARTLLALLLIFALVGIGFHALIQDRAGDAFWLLVGLSLSRAMFRGKGIVE